MGECGECFFQDGRNVGVIGDVGVVGTVAVLLRVRICLLVVLLIETVFFGKPFLNGAGGSSLLGWTKSLLRRGSPSW